MSVVFDSFSLRKFFAGFLFAGTALAVGFLSNEILELKTRKYLKEKIFEEKAENLLYPLFPIEEWRPEQIQVRPFRRKRGDYIIEARRPPFEPVVWTLNKYTLELIPWIDGKTPQKSPLE